VRRFVRKFLLLLVLAAGFGRNGPGRAQRREIRRVLLIRPDHLGDLLFTTPALAELRRALPEAHITYLIGPWFREIAARNPHVDEIQTCAFPGFRRETQGAFEPYRLLWRMARDLRRQRYDLAIVLRPDFWWGAWLMYLAGIPLRLGYAAELQTPCLTWALPLRDGEHAVRQNLRLVQAVALLANRKAIQSKQLDNKSSIAALTEQDTATFPQGEPPLEFAPTDEERAWVRARLGQAGVADGERLVVIHPGTGAPVKLWETASWARVADVLARVHSMRVVLTGSEGERKQVEAICSQMNEQTLVLVGETNLGTLAALLARADLVLGVDNGPLHLATAQGTPTVRIYGPTDQRIFGPWGDPRLHRTLQTTQPCAGCAAIPCGRIDWRPEELPAHPCVRSVPVEEMLTAVEAMLHQIAERQKQKKALSGE
jgi:lipopolysaccharide heptosyltransferase II